MGAEEGPWMRRFDRLEGVDPGRERWTGRQDPDPGGAYIRLGGGGEREAETKPRTLLSPIAAEVRDSGEAATVLAPSFPRWCSSTGWGRSPTGRGDSKAGVGFARANWRAARLWRRPAFFTRKRLPPPVCASLRGLPDDQRHGHHASQSSAAGSTSLFALPSTVSLLAAV